jgi:hypothetical protein
MDPELVGFACLIPRRHPSQHWLPCQISACLQVSPSSFCRDAGINGNQLWLKSLLKNPFGPRGTTEELPARSQIKAGVDAASDAAAKGDTEFFNKLLN